MVKQTSSRRSNITTSSSTSFYIPTFHRISCPDQCQDTLFVDCEHLQLLIQVMSPMLSVFAVLSSFISCAAKQINVFLSWFISDQSELLNNPIFMVGQVPIFPNFFFANSFISAICIEESATSKNLTA